MSTCRALTAAVVLLCLSGCFGSDESVLRGEFRIPSDARLVSLTAHPETPGWFGREGLEISAEFVFSADGFRAFEDQAAPPEWKALPVPDEFLSRMTGIRSYLEALERTQQVIGQAAPQLASRTLPTEEELLQQWRDRLPLEIDHGLYACRTAGDNIMYATRVDCATRSGDLDDFMFAVLDRQRQTLRIQVHTSY